MSTAARYAEMADPERNPQFRRRWHDPRLEGGMGSVTPEDAAPADGDRALDQLALVLSADFRAARAGGCR